jgi:hypothetical protein
LRKNTNRYHRFVMAGQSFELPQSETSVKDRFTDLLVASASSSPGQDGRNASNLR